MRGRVICGTRAKAGSTRDWASGCAATRFCLSLLNHIMSPNATPSSERSSSVRSQRHRPRTLPTLSLSASSESSPLETVDSHKWTCSTFQSSMLAGNVEIVTALRLGCHLCLQSRHCRDQSGSIRQWCGFLYDVEHDFLWRCRPRPFCFSDANVLKGFTSHAGNHVHQKNKNTLHPRPGMICHSRAIPPHACIRRVVPWVPRRSR